MIFWEKPKQSFILTEEEKQIIKKYAIDGDKTIYDIGNLLSRPVYGRAIYAYCRNQHITIKKLSKQEKRHPHTSAKGPHLTFFKKWSPEMAYFFGYWCADGNMQYNEQKGAYAITYSMHPKDEYLGDKIGKYLADNIGKCRGKNKQIIQYTLCNKEMVEDLQRLGGTPRKSLTLILPQIPSSFIFHFLRGYTDGDGCVNSAGTSWNITGTRMFCEAVYRRLVEEFNFLETDFRLSKPYCPNNNITIRLATANWSVWGKLYKLLYDQVDELDLPFLIRKRIFKINHRICRFSLQDKEEIKRRLNNGEKIQNIYQDYKGLVTYNYFTGDFYRSLLANCNYQVLRRKNNDRKKRKL